MSSRLLGILSQGLRIAPPEAPVTGMVYQIVWCGVNLTWSMYRLHVWQRFETMQRLVHETSTDVFSLPIGVYFADVSGLSQNVESVTDFAYPLQMMSKVSYSRRF